MRWRVRAAGPARSIDQRDARRPHHSRRDDRGWRSRRRAKGAVAIRRKMPSRTQQQSAFKKRQLDGPRWLKTLTGRMQPPESGTCSEISERPPHRGRLDTRHGRIEQGRDKNDKKRSCIRAKEDVTESSTDGE